MENAALLSDRFEIPLAQRGFADLVLSEQDIDLLILKHETDERIAERFKKCRANPGVSLSQTIFEVLSSNRYRYGPKAYHESAQAINEGKIARAQARELPIFLTFSFFPAKAPNPLKTFGSSCAGVDMGECASLLRLYELAAILSQAYEPGVRWLVGMDGVKYHEVFGIPKPEALRYRDNIIKLAEFLGIAEYFEFVEETDLYPPEFTDHKDRNVEQILQAYQG